MSGFVRLNFTQLERGRLFLGKRSLFLQGGLRHLGRGGRTTRERSRRLVTGTPIAGDGLAGEQPPTVPLERRLDQRGRLRGDDVGPMLRLTALGLRRRRLGSLTAILGKRLSRQSEPGRGPPDPQVFLDGSGWRHGHFRAGHFCAGYAWRLLSCLLATALSPLRPEALAAATAAPPTPGSVFKLSCGRLVGGGRAFRSGTYWCNACSTLLTGFTILGLTALVPARPVAPPARPFAGMRSKSAESSCSSIKSVT